MKRTLIIILSLLAVFTPIFTISAAQAGDVIVKADEAVTDVHVDDVNVQADGTADYADEADAVYICTEYPLERNGISLHLDCTYLDNTQPDRSQQNGSQADPSQSAPAAAKDQILLVHGSTYSSHEFDINYEDYSLVRALAQDGYAVWRLDIAGYGQSEEVEDGFMPDTAYAAEDIRAAVETIAEKTGQDKIDVLGWSWGTMTAGMFAGKYPEHLDQLVLYAPILSGLGEKPIETTFNHNTWAGAAEDFQTDADGNFDLAFTDPILIDMWCSSCWKYDGDSSPNGWRKDALVDKDIRLIDLEAITVPTLVICGGNDPYLDYERVEASLESLPEGSDLCIIPGGSHIVMYEKPYYQEFQDQVLAFLD